MRSDIIEVFITVHYIIYKIDQLEYCLIFRIAKELLQDDICMELYLFTVYMLEYCI